MATTVRTIYEQPSASEVHAQHTRVVEQLGARFPAVDQWALCSLQASPGYHEFYDRRRAAGDLHHQALRALGNRLVGYLHGCLRTCSHYDEATA